MTRAPLEFKEPICAELGRNAPDDRPLPAYMLPDYGPARAGDLMGTTALTSIPLMIQPNKWRTLSDADTPFTVQIDPKLWDQIKKIGAISKP